MKQSELKAILKDHKLWLDSHGKQGKRALAGYADLQGVNLCNANLQGADLARASLEEANLRGANLARADLRDANLDGVYLRGANLTGANLQGENLTGADLRDANLQGVNLAGANLVDAKFTTNFKKVRWFDRASFSEDQLPWVVLHPRYSKCAHTLKWVKAKADAA